MDKLGIKTVFDGTSGIVSDAFIQGLGPLAEGVLAFREGAPVEKLPAANSSWRSTARRNTTTRQRPTGHSHSPRWT